MRRSSVMVTAVALAVGAVGCHGAPRYANITPSDPNCAPADGCDNDLVIPTPKQRYVVKPPCGPSETCAPQSQCVPQVQGTTQAQGMPQPQGFQPQGFQQQGMVGFQPQGVIQPMGMMGAAPFGAASSGSSSTTVTTNQRTRLALTTTTIRIPIPWIKLMPFTEAPETTIRITGTQTAQAQGFQSFQGFGGAMGVTPAGFVAGGSLPGAPGSFIQGQVVGPPVAQGVGMTGVQGGVTSQAQGTCPPNSANDPNAITPARVEALRKKIEELEAAQKEKDAKKDAAPPPKEKP